MAVVSGENVISKSKNKIMDPTERVKERDTKGGFLCMLQKMAWNIT